MAILIMCFIAWLFIFLDEDKTFKSVRNKGIDDESAMNC